MGFAAVSRWRHNRCRRGQGKRCFFQEIKHSNLALIEGSCCLHPQFLRGSGFSNKQIESSFDRKHRPNYNWAPNCNWDDRVTVSLIVAYKLRGTLGGPYGIAF
jgi:hypothetical protein